MGAIQLNAVEKWYDELQVIKGIDLDIKDGEFIIFVGPSGCGKSTLLRMIGGLEETSRGAIVLDGKDVTDQPPSKRGLSMVFQSYALYPHMTVRDNMGFSLKTAGAPKSEITEKVNEAARVLKLEPLLDRRPKDMSGGQRQRVGVARALAGDPELLIMDEPFGALDPITRDALGVRVRELHDTLGLTTVMVTHDMAEALLLADRVLVMDAGALVADQTPRELLGGAGGEVAQGLVAVPRDQAEKLAAMEASIARASSTNSNETAQM